MIPLRWKNRIFPSKLDGGRDERCALRDSAARQRASSGLAAPRTGLSCGKSTFSNDDARALAALLEEMDLVIGESAMLRQTVPEIAPQLNLYKLQLLQLQTTVERLQVALLARRADLETRRVGVDAASRWCISLRQTR